MEQIDYNAEINKKFDKLLELVRNSREDPAVALADEIRVREAFDFACEAHHGQMRRSGEPYITHPLEVSLIIADMCMDVDSIIASLTHDVVEDTDFELGDIKQRFGASVADLVDGVTKLTRVNYTSKEEQQMENLRKMIIAMAKDIRVVLIKIADRLHNMRTLSFHTEKRQKEISLETMEIYAPLAYRLGIQKIKWELEDIALKYLDPVGYNEIMMHLEEMDKAHSCFLEVVKDAISDKLRENGIEFDISGRMKHIYSVYRKMMGQNKELNEIYDLYAVRIIVDEMPDCYNVLGLVHDLFKPLPGRIKDYISTPKPNMYQSLHTTVMGHGGMPFEVQTRTWDMHRTAEYGIAAHWKYKQGIESDSSKLEDKLAWVRRLMETQQDTEAEDFIRMLKVDMFADEVFVFTPKGDVINLPAGANPIDFAYAIHSAVGNRMTGAKIGGRIVSLDYTLQNGDIVDILQGSGHGPSRDWLKMVKTSEARNKIKQWFKKEKREDNIIAGKADFERELRRVGIPLATVLQEDIQAAVVKRMAFSTMDDLYASIGFGGTTCLKAINRFRDELAKANKLNNEKQIVEKLIQSPKKPKKNVSGVVVEGIDNCLVKFSRCCAPVPGDDIIGFITRGYGVSIHCKDCLNVIQQRKDDKDGRWIEVSWADEIKESYACGLQVQAHDRDGLLMDVLNVINAAKVKLLSISAKSYDDGYAAVNAVAEVSSKAEFDELRSRLLRISAVVDIKRKDVH